MVPLGSAQTIDATGLAVEGRHRRRGSAAGAGATLTVRSLVSRNRARLAKACLGSGRPMWGMRHVFIVPDGSLSLVPFAALPTGQRSYLLETGPVIHYLSAERDSFRRPSMRPTRRGLLAVGGPRSTTVASSASGQTVAYVERTDRGADRAWRWAACGGLQSVTFQPLGGTLREVRDLSGLWKANPTTESGASRPRGPRRERSRFNGMPQVTGPARRHARLLPERDCAADPAALAGRWAVDGRRPATVENPLLLSGLALAGANRRASAGRTKTTAS